MGVWGAWCSKIIIKKINLKLDKLLNAMVKIITLRNWEHKASQHKKRNVLNVKSGNN